MNLKQFIENHSEDIDNYNFEKIYQDIPFNIIKVFTSLLYDSGLNPLLYMSEVPEKFLIDSTSIKSITIPNNIKKIGDHAFYNCSSLTSVTIPNSVIAIGRCVFGGCTSLTEITFGGTKQQWKNMSEESFWWDSASSIKKIICIDGEVVL